MKPIFEELKKYAHGSLYPFCMPGHKKGNGMDFQSVNPFNMDITEIDGLDNLHNPTGIIKTAQELAAKTFGAKESFFLVNGSSAGIQAAILACVFQNQEIIIARNSHKSVYNGIILSGATPRYIFPEFLNELGFFGGVTPKQVEEAIFHNKNAKAVVITSPTYEGIVSDVAEIANVVHKHNMILIVDEAHGAHFKFNGYFPKTALECGADVVIQSLHKTLPSLTQTAILHIQGDTIDRDRIASSLSMMQSTSPSYVFMAGIDCCRDFIDSKGEVEFENYALLLKEYRQKFKALENIKLLDDEILNHHATKELDFGKLVFSVKGENLNAFDISRILREEYNLQMEMSQQNHFIAMTSVCDDRLGIERLFAALCEIDKRVIPAESTALKVDMNGVNPTIKLSPRQGYFASKKKVDMKLSVGQVSADFIVPYPPGIPLIVPGEVIDEYAIDFINKFHNDTEILGIQYNGHFMINICN